MPTHSKDLSRLETPRSSLSVSRCMSTSAEYEDGKLRALYYESQTLHISHDGGWPFPYGILGKEYLRNGF